MSSILNGKDARFPQETRDRVFAAAAELGYRPSHAGRALAMGKSDIVLLLVPNATFGAQLQDGIDSLAGVAATHGLTLLVRFADPDADETLRAILNLRPAVVVDLGVLDQAGRDLVQAAGVRPVPQAIKEEPDEVDLLIGRIQVTEAFAHGRRRLIYASLADWRLDPVGPIRLRGAEAEAASRGADLTHIHVPLTADGATQALAEANAGSTEPLAVCCYNDDVAIAVLAAARKLGLAVPDEISVIGVDHTAIGQLVTPRLTSIAVDFAGLMEALLRELDTNGHGLPPSPDWSSFVRLAPGDTT
ncbi:LacI family DNA-binding transcriptional regulator [Acrocarpospora macrocephala]|uniref:LacI family transcriptional regulator n=1 Tax=Acrocarpospora macrocephala TaxID=150177 RepID=A0A5M3X1I7_9ACTN|nr:LacI family transcriptional regulator [Acrocarpospora macrocephala]